jgi:ABC-type amino acid transport substrate-binding protein
MPLGRPVLLSALALLAGVLAAGSTAAADLPEIKARGVLRVLRVESGPRDEFFSLEAAGPPGFDHEVLEGFCRLHKVRLEAISLSGWDALIPNLLQGKGDLIAGRFTATDGRRKLIAFTSEVFPSRNVVLTRKPHAPVLTLEALRAQRVGTIKGTSMAEAVAVAGVPADRVVDSILPGGLPAALRAAEVTAVVLGVESAIAATREDPRIELGMFLGAPASLAYGVRKEDLALLRALNDYIDNLRRTPTWSRLVVKYFGASSLEILHKARQ